MQGTVIETFNRDGATGCLLDLNEPCTLRVKSQADSSRGSWELSMEDFCARSWMGAQPNWVPGFDYISASLAPQ